ncbi:hypothetical protein PsorP6_008682 [Peronosclerospora sorghi]|uniref:Uncharacterized protein n=1 Tax=Peronosclerospora sorghi TaxID=230839 RepID=A0ACC0VXW6_9STRA|nr:hypothetical protein PsorP6_008682 [Peronosclerospora sorghi]
MTAKTKEIEHIAFQVLKFDHINTIASFASISYKYSRELTREPRCGKSSSNLRRSTYTLRKVRIQKQRHELLARDGTIAVHHQATQQIIDVNNVVKVQIPDAFNSNQQSHKLRSDFIVPIID